VVNLAVSGVLTVVFRRFGLQDGYDETRPADYIADPVPAAAPGRARKAEPAAGGKAPRDSAIPWSLGAATEKAPAPEKAVTARKAPAAEAPAAEDDVTVVFDIPVSLAGRPQTRERLPRRK
jgi:hypothetical protein